MRDSGDDVATHNQVGRRRVLQGLGALGAVGAGWAAFGSDPAEANGSAGTNGTVITVAASNTPSQLSANADWLCSGTDDDGIIMSAIGQLGSNGTGEVVLLPGDYYLGSGSGNVIKLNNQWGGLKLSGSLGSTLHIPAGSSAPAAIIMSAYGSPGSGPQAVANLKIKGPQSGTGTTCGIWCQSSGSIIENVQVQYAPGHGFLIDGAPSSNGGSVSQATYNNIISNCTAQQCGYSAVAGGARGDGFHVTYLCESSDFTSCFVNGGNPGSGAGLVTGFSPSGSGPYTSLAVLNGAWGNLSSGAQLVVCNPSGVTDVNGGGSDIGYSMVKTTASVTSGQSSIPVTSFTPGETFTASQTVVLDPTTFTTGVGFFTVGPGCHFNDCHAYYCWLGFYLQGAAGFIQGGEYETNAAVNVQAILPATGATNLGCQFQVLGINSYGSPVLACINLSGGQDSVQIADCFINAGDSAFGIVSTNAINHSIHDNVIHDGFGPGQLYNGSAAISYSSANNVDIHDNVILITQDKNGNRPTLKATHYGIQVQGAVNSSVHDNNVTESVLGYSTPISIPAVYTNTGTTVRNNPGYNPVGSQTVSVPTSGGTAGPWLIDQTFYIKTGAGTTTVAIGGGPSLPLTASALNPIRIPAGVSFTITYANAPTFYVEGE